MDKRSKNKVAKTKTDMKSLEQIVLDLRAADPDSTAANDIQAFIDANPGPSPCTTPTPDNVTVTIGGVNFKLVRV